MLPFLALVGVASATHVTTFDVNVKWTKPPISGLQSLTVDPAVAIAQLQPVHPPFPADVEKVTNEAAPGEKALVFTNPLSQWSDLTINGMHVGIIGPYATMRIDGVGTGQYLLQLQPPNKRVRTFAVRVLPKPPVAKPVKVALVEDHIDLSDKVHFDLDSATILPQSYGLLDAVAAEILAHPQVLVVRIEGNTDSRGETAYNQALSESRAASVRDYLVQKGVPADHLDPVGYGETRPLDPADNEDAWEKNRRVDFVVEKRELPPPPPVEPDPKKKAKKR